MLPKCYSRLVGNTQSSANLLSQLARKEIMPQYNPIYGELLSSREVADVTGFTLNQLRNQRQRPERSPFPFIRLGGTSLYRRADIDSWIGENGGLDVQYVVQPHHKPAPLEVTEASEGKRQALAKLSAITTENSFSSMATWVIEKSGISNGTSLIHNEGRRLLAIERGIEDWQSLPRPAVTMKETDQEGFWKIWTYGVRKAYAQANQLDVTDEEIIKIPVGDVPPLREK